MYASSDEYRKKDTTTVFDVSLPANLCLAFNVFTFCVFIYLSVYLYTKKKTKKKKKIEQMKEGKRGKKYRKGKRGGK